MSEIETAFSLPGLDVLRSIVHAALAACFVFAAIGLAFNDYVQQWPVLTRALAQVALAACTAWEVAKCQKAWREYVQRPRVEPICHESLPR